MDANMATLDADLEDGKNRAKMSISTMALRVHNLERKWSKNGGRRCGAGRVAGYQVRPDWKGSLRTKS
jgi:hypothetical protein